MAYEVVMPYHLHMPSYFLGTFTEYPILVMTDSFSSPVVTLLVTSVSPSGKGIRAIGDE